MRSLSILNGIRRRAHLPVLLLLLVLTGAAFAQDDAAPADAETAAAAAEAEVDVGNKHPYSLSVTGSLLGMIPINILKEEIYDINDLTGNSAGFGVDLRLYLLDGLAFSVGGARTGFGLVDGKTAEMDAINGRFEADPITPDNFIRLDGLNFSLITYLGNQLTPDSRFNPYIRGAVLYYDWALQENGRDSDTVVYQDKLIEGTDLGAGLGFGTEYRLGEKLMLDTELFWGYILTGDDILFEGLQAPSNGSYYWTNTHFWQLRLGLTLGL